MINKIQEYVLVFPHHPWGDEEVLLVLKDRPEYLKGRLNLVGGHVEEGEHHKDAALREYQEEVGLELYNVKYSGVFLGVGNNTPFKVHCYTGKTVDGKITPREGETEIVAWYKWEEVKKSPLLLHNLRIMIPLMWTGINNWSLSEENEKDRKSVV